MSDDFREMEVPDEWMTDPEDYASEFTGVAPDPIELADAVSPDLGNWNPNGENDEWSQ